MSRWWDETKKVAKSDEGMIQTKLIIHVTVGIGLLISSGKMFYGGSYVWGVILLGFTGMQLIELRNTLKQKRLMIQGKKLLESEENEEA